MKYFLITDTTMRILKYVHSKSYNQKIGLRLYARSDLYP